MSISRVTTISVATIFSLLVSWCSTGNADLVHRYLFEVDGRDSVGGAHATLHNGAWIQDGAVHLNGGQNHYVSMPIGATMGNLGSELSIETWVHSFPLNSDDYYRVFDLGSGSSEHIAMSPRDHLNLHWLGLRDTNGANEQHHFSRTSGQHVNHMVLTFENGTASFYINGILDLSVATSFSPSNLGETTRNWLGRSPNINNPYLNGFIQEFNIYTHALSSQQVLANYQRGPSVPEPTGLVTATMIGVAFGGMRRRVQSGTV